MGGTNNDISYSIAIDAAGNVYTTGYFEATADFNPNAGVANLTSAGTYDVFISKLDASGNFVWAKNMSGTGDDAGYSITTDAIGNVYTTGFFSGIVDFDPSAGIANLISVGIVDIFISKLDASGNFIWSKSMGGYAYDVGYSIAVDAVGNVYTTGFFSGIVDFDPNTGVANLTSTSGWDIFISKLDASGDLVWAKNMGGSNNDSGYSIVLDAASNVYTTGFFGNIADFDPNAGVANLTSAGNYDIFTSKLDANGNFIWAKNMGGTSDDRGHSTALDATGNIYTVGYFSGTADFDPNAGVTNSISAGFNDIFVAKYIQCPTITISPANLPNALVGSTYNQTLTQTGLVGAPMWSVVSGSLPNGVTIVSGTGLISGIPTALGIFNFTLQVVNGGCLQTKAYTVSICPTITFGTPVVTAGVVGTAYNLNAGATASSGTLGYTIAPSLPAGLTLNSTTGTISGTPTVITASNSYTVTAATSAACNNTKLFTFEVIRNPATNIDSDLANSIKISPNPSNGDFNVDFGTINMAKSSVRVYDVQGKVVFTSENNANASGNLMLISLEKFANGIYLLEVKTSKGRVLKRLSKTN